MQKTLSIIKPDAVSRNLIGKINTILEEEFEIIAQKMLQLTLKQAGDFYEVHKLRPFYEDLKKIMSSGPIVVQVLRGKDAIIRYRDIMGATNPKEAKLGTLRATYGISLDQNSVHGSDSEENAMNEIAYFFANYELVK